MCDDCLGCRFRSRFRDGMRRFLTLTRLFMLICWSWSTLVCGPNCLFAWWLRISASRMMPNPVAKFLLVTESITVSSAQSRSCRSNLQTNEWCWFYKLDGCVHWDANGFSWGWRWRWGTDSSRDKMILLKIMLFQSNVKIAYANVKIM